MKSNILSENSIKKAWSNPILEKLDVTKTAGTKNTHHTEQGDASSGNSCKGPGNLSLCY